MWNLSNLKNLVKINNTAFTYAGNNLLNPIEVKADGLTNLTVIETGAFRYCNKISKINLSGCTKLNFVGSAQTFAYMNNLESVDFTDCPALNFLCDGIVRNNPVFTHIVGWDVLKNQITKIDQNAFGWSPLFNDEINGMQNLISIGTSAFERCEASWAINDWPKIESLGERAFALCPSLGEFNFSGSTTLKSLGNQLFAGVSKTDTAYGPTKLDCTNCTELTYVGKYLLVWNNKTTEVVFDNCTSLVRFGASETSGEGAFEECIGLVKISARNCTSLHDLGNRFHRHDSTINAALTTVDLTGCSELTHLGVNAFSKTNSLGKLGWLDEAGDWDIYLPHEKYPKLEYIDSSLFSNSTNTGIRKVDCHGLIGTEPIHNSAFIGLSRVTEIDLHDCTNAVRLGQPATTGTFIFAGNYLKTINLSGWTNCTEICDRVFSAHGLTSIGGSTPNVLDLDEVFPDLQKIGEVAFADATTGGARGSVTLKCTNGNLTSIGAFAFGHNTNFKEIRIKANGDLAIGDNAFARNAYATLIDVEVGGDLFLEDRCFAGDREYMSTSDTGSSSPLIINLRCPNAPILIDTTYPSTVTNIKYAIGSGIGYNGAPIEFHFPSASQTAILEKAKEYEDASTDGYLNYFCTSNGTGSTTTGGTTGDKTVSTADMYNNYVKIDWASKWGGPVKIYGTVNVGTAPSSVAVVFDL